MGILAQPTMAARRPGADSGLTSAGARRRQVSAPGSLKSAPLQRTACNAAPTSRASETRARNSALWKPGACTVRLAPPNFAKHRRRLAPTG